MNHDVKYKIGDLVYIINDCYIFLKERAKIIKTGGFAVVIGIQGPEEHKNNPQMMKFWAESVKVQIGPKISGWVLKENLILICNEDE